MRHTVLWQASIDGQVTLEEEAGFLPVQDVIVEYRMEDLQQQQAFVLPACEDYDQDGWCRTKTGASGKFTISLSLVHPSLNNDDEFPVRLRFAKTTSSIVHRFLCNDSTKDCSTTIPEDDDTGDQLGDGSTPIITEASKVNTTVVYLRHLEFEAPVHVIDDTTVPFRGTVKVHGTEMPGAGALGCPIVGAQVCMVDHTTRNALQVTDPSVCVQTDNKGNYALPAVIGTTISPQVRYHNHEFRPINPDHAPLFEQGILINPDGIYENFDLHDITTALLTIEVAGGLCDRVLGQTELSLTMQGCEWDGQALIQDGFRQIYRVIAQPIDVRVVTVTGLDDNQERNVIMESLDLRDLEEEDAAEEESSLPQGVGGKNNDSNNGTSTSLLSTNEAIDNTDLDPDSLEAAALEEEEKKEKAKTDMKRIRFQYDGTDVLQVRFGNMDTGTCGSSAREEGVDSYSLHVLPSFTFFVVHVMARQEFGFDIISCSRYPANTTISIQNQVGVIDSPGDREFLSQLEGNPDFTQQVQALQACSPSCSHPLQMDEATGENAQASVVLLSGQPNPFGSTMTKPLFVVMDKSGSIHKSDVVVTGDFALAGSQSVALPTHKPLLVLRDPPGGSSYAYYENMISTIRMEMKDYETFVGLDVSMKGSFGTTSEIQTCAGLFVEMCLELIEGKIKKTLKGAGETNFLVSLIDEKTAGSFTTTWSFQTSTEVWVAGKDSDIFLVPNLNAKFQKVQEVGFNKSNVFGGTCAFATEKTKFSLTSPENKPGIGFLSRFEIDKVEIPELTGLRDAAQSNMTVLNCNKTVDDKTTEDCVKAIITRDVMVHALQDWNGFLERHLYRITQLSHPSSYSTLWILQSRMESQRNASGLRNRVQESHGKEIWRLRIVSKSILGIESRRVPSTL